MKRGKRRLLDDLYVMFGTKKGKRLYKIAKCGERKKNWDLRNFSYIYYE